MQYFFNLPRPVLIIMGVLAATSITGVIAAIDYRLAGIVFLGMMLVAGAVGVFVAIRNWLGRRHAARLAGDLQQHSGAAPIGINDAGQKAKLDALRRTFGEGLAKFGGLENVYKFPWYLIVGESGSGKTEAVRHCNVGFPPGLQDELQGVGGTINMNWWFTNHAVFLDTAGRMMFEEVKAGETNEWREFLALLKRNRPNCPINGLLLIIPADSLIKDGEEEINRKAGRIAQQFEVIQRTLDIRFPVFILITKCDLLSGFREFFDDFNDAQSQHQMIGWSNRDDRDAAFRPDLVAQYIGTVVQRIEKRRLSLLRDPIPQKGQERRTDEVDALYGLPQSVQLIAPKVRSYLEKIFIAGPWSPKPLFLRGIYFTSSMREGSALDQELALALGLRPDELRESRQWERERAYFLRDLFTEKVFPERGLVTRATNTRKMLRTRSVVLWGTATALALLLLGSSFYFARELEDSVNAQSKYWAAAKIWERPGIWNPLIEPEAQGSLRADYKGDETVLTAGGGNVSRLAFHQTLLDLAAQELKTGWVFKPMLRWVRVDGDRQIAQRIVFEGGVVSPVVKAARQRMQLEKIEDAPDANLSTGARLLREADALAGLIRIESDALDKNVNLETLPKGMMEPLLVYATARAEPLNDSNSALLSTETIRTYSQSFRDRPKAAWPPPWLPLGATTLAKNQPIDAGLKRLQALANESVKAQVSGLAQIKSLRDDLRLFRQKEREMDSTVAVPEQESRAAKLEALFSQLASIKTSVDKKVADAKQQGFFIGGGSFLKTTYDRLVGDSQAGSNSSFKVVKAAVQPQLNNKDNRLFSEVNQILDTTQESLRDEIAKGFDESELKELAELDEYLTDFGNGKRIYEVRWDWYADTHHEATLDDALGDLIGKGWAKLVEIQAAIAGKRRQVEFVRQRLADPFSGTCLFFLDRAASLRLARVAPAYLRQSYNRFDQDFFEPLVRTSKSAKESSRNQAFKDIREWQSDIKSDAFPAIDTGTRSKLERFNAELEKIKTYIAALDNYAVSVGYEPGDNREFYFKFRKVHFKGSTYDTDTQSFSDTYRYGGQFSLTCIDYTSGQQHEVSIGRDVASLIRDPAIRVEDAVLHLHVTPKGEAPRAEDQPDKNFVLSILK